MVEQRQRAERFPLPLPVRYRSLAEAEWSAGRTANISGTGILFAADRELAVGTQIELHLPLEADDQQWPSEVVARAAVVRIVPRQPQSASVELAARFLDHRLLPRQLGQV